jgi:hypothetical protein
LQPVLTNPRARRNHTKASLRRRIAAIVSLYAKDYCYMGFMQWAFFEV